MYYLIPSMVVHELTDGEAVIINLAVGFYYYLDKTAAAIWSLITQGRSENEIVEIISKQTQSESSYIMESIKKFLEDLKKEDLITVSPSPVPPGHDEKTSVEYLNAPYQVPLLNKYTDMKDFFQADPIHDVDEKGWPHLKSNFDLELS